MVKPRIKKINVDKRVFLQSSAKSMPSLYEVMVEFITNVDDSYERLGQKENNKCVIAYNRGGKKNPSILSVKDRAEGMDTASIEKNFSNYGMKLSGKATRGYAGRGAKDASAVGELQIESIFNNKYSRAVIEHGKAEVKFYEEDVKVNKEHINSVGVGKNQNGTHIKLTIPPKSDRAISYHPLEEKIFNSLPNHYALTDILHIKNKSLDILFKSKDINNKLIHTPPEGDLIAEKEFYVDKYKKEYGEDSKVIFKLYKSKVNLSSSDDGNFKRWGLSVKGIKAVHEKSFLDESLSSLPESKYFFGYLKTNLFSKLAEKFDENGVTDDLNPVTIFDTDRLGGINRNHPCTELIFKEPIRILKNIFAEERIQNKNENITDENLQKDLDKVANIITEEMKDIIDESDNEYKNQDIPTNKWIMIPPTLVMNKGEEKFIYLYTNRNSLKSGVETANISINKDSDIDAIEILTDKSIFFESKKNKKLYYFKFRIKALKESKSEKIDFYHNGQIKTEGKIIINNRKNHDFENDIDFEKELFKIKEGTIKNINYYAKFPEVVSNPIRPNLNIDTNVFEIKSISECNPINGTNYAFGTISVKSKRIGSERELKIDLNKYFGGTKLLGVGKKDKDEDPPSNKFKIDIVDKKLGNNRSAWDLDDPFKLLIAAKHQQIQKFLGEQPSFYGQKTPLFKVLLTEIISEAMTYKKFAVEAQFDPENLNSIFKKSTNEAIIEMNYKFESEKMKWIDLIGKIIIKDSTIQREIDRHKDTLD